MYQKPVRMISPVTVPTQSDRTAGEFPVDVAGTMSYRPVQAFRSERGGAVRWDGPCNFSAVAASGSAVGSLEGSGSSLGFLLDLRGPLHTPFSPPPLRGVGKGSYGGA